MSEARISLASPRVDGLVVMLLVYIDSPKTNVNASNCKVVNLNILAL